MDVAIVELETADTWPLRRAVLRNDTPSPVVVLDGDDDPATLHLGARDGNGHVIAVSTWIRRRLPGDDEAAVAVQLRAMATDPALRGRGLGRLLVEHGLVRLAADGVDVVWANARDTALGFYIGLGFDVVGEGFVDPTTALPHHRVARRVGTASVPPR